MLCIFLLRDTSESLKCYLDLWLSSLLDCIHFCVFFLSLKNCFLSNSTDPRQIAIYRAPWTSFLNRSYHIFDPLSYLEFISIASRQILNPLIKFLFG